MNRRDFLKAVGVGVVASGVRPSDLWAGYGKSSSPDASNSAPKFRDEDLDNYLSKIRDFDRDYPNDTQLDEKRYRLLKSTLNRFLAIQKRIGHAGFHLLDFDDALKLARNNANIGAFTSEELDFLENIFYETASEYGFLGDKPMKNLTDRIPLREVIKIPSTGNFLYKGLPLKTYLQVKKALGDKVILTSGVRGVSKQFLLFLNKANESQGNLSRASRSLAPPGYSYHGISDFDVGQKDFGAANFTARFVTTEVYQRLVELGFLQLRYPRDNLLGVRFEPWHIKVNT
ncbi:MAG: M15 family metallopeptidase [Magnetococcus sp. DMHC-6]